MPRPLARTRFKSLRVNPGFRDFVLDQLADVPSLQARPMFGGFGLYSGEVFFGIIAADVLYLKVGDANRADFRRVGARPFAPYADRPASMNYYSVPTAVLESASDLATWAARSIAVARAPRVKSGQRGRRSALNRTSATESRSSLAREARRFVGKKTK